jgi:hypothetical protein
MRDSKTLLTTVRDKVVNTVSKFKTVSAHGLMLDYLIRIGAMISEAIENIRIVHVS